MRRTLTPAAVPAKSKQGPQRPSMVELSRQHSGMRSLEGFDSEFFDHYSELNSVGDELSAGLTPSLSGEEVLKALENNNEGLRKNSKLSSAISKVSSILDAIRVRLLILMEGKESVLNELASSLVMISECGSVADQRSAALVLEAILRWDDMDLSQFEKGDSSLTVKFASLLRIVLTKSSERLALTAAARALGKLARVSDSASRVDFVRFETVRAMEWLHLDAHANRRLAAVLILRYLTEMVPMLFVTHDHASSFFDHVGSALLDKSPQTRFAAREALQAFFELIQTREDQKLCFVKCYAIVRRGIEHIHTADSIHGALLAVGEMFRNPNELLRSAFYKLCHEILRFRSHSDTYVVQAVIRLVPELAAFSQDFTSTPQFQVSVDMLIYKARPGNADRATNEAALDSLGRLVARLGPAAPTIFANDVGRIVSVVREGLRCVDLAQPALVCLCLLAKSLGEMLLNESLSLLDDAFTYPAGLTQGNEWLQAIEAFMPVSAARPLIRARLIHEISVALTAKPFSVPAFVPRPNLSPEDVEEEEDLLFFIQVLSKQSSSNGGGGGGSSAAKVLALDPLNNLQQSALKALGRFDFGPLNLLPFLKQRVSLYMDSRSPLRMEACSACVQTLNRQHQQGFLNNFKSTATTNELVRGILFLATADLDPSVRYFATNLLTEHVTIFGPFLAQARSVNMLFTALNDSKFQVRHAAVKLVQRVCHINPGVVLPFLRKYVISLIGSLRTPTSKREETETATILEDLIRDFHQSGSRELGDALLGPFMETILKEVVHKLKGSTQPSAHMIQILGACASASDPFKVLEKMLEEVMPIVTSAALDSEASQKQRESALSTLTELLRKTESIGMKNENRELIDPLLEIASAPPNSVFAWSLQREALRCLGTLGALDPASHRRSANTSEEASEHKGPRYMIENTGPDQDDFGLNVLAVGRPSKRRKARVVRSESGSFGTSNSLGRSSLGVRLLSYDRNDEERDREEVPEVPDDAASDSSSDQSDSEENLLPVRGPVAEFGSSTQEQLEIHFRLVAVQALTKILKTPALASFHAHVVEAAGNTCRSLGVDTVPYLSRLVPAMIRVAVAPRCDPELRRTTIKQLTVFISVMKKHMRPYIRDVLAVAKLFWDDNLFEALALVEESSSALREEFVVHIGWVIPKLILALRKVTDSGLLNVGLSKKVGSRAIDVPTAAMAAAARGASGASVLSTSSNNKYLKDNSILDKSGTTSILVTDGTNSPGSSLVSKTGSGSPSTSSFAPLPSEDAITRRALGTVQFLGLWISESEHSHRVAAEIMNILESRAASEATKIRSLEVMRQLCQHDTFTMDVLPIVQTVVRILCASVNGSGHNLSNNNIDLIGPQTLVGPAMELFSVLIERCQHEISFEPFVDMLPERFRARLQRKRTFESMLANQQEREDASEDGNSVSSAAGSVEESGNNILLTGAMISEVSKSRSNSAASLPSVKSGDNGGTAFGPLSVNPHKLREALEASQATTEDDWSEWMRRFAVELLRESPDPTLRACASVAQAHNPLAKDLFNAAFVSCWTRLSDDDRSVMVRTLKAAFNHKNTPPDVLHVLLNLCEFMEHNDRPLPIEKLSEYAMKCHAYAKALHYKELEFRTSKSSVTVDDLIGINHRLERPEAAQGLLKIAQNQTNAMLESAASPLVGISRELSTSSTTSSSNNGSIISSSTPFSNMSLSHRRRGSVNAITVQVRETWFEQLGRWRDALESYENKLAQIPEDSVNSTAVDLTVGSMRCMLSLGEYDKLCSVGKRKWKVFDNPTKQRMAPLIAHALWEKGADSTEMQQFLPFLDVSSLDGAVLNSVAAIQRGDWLSARSLLDEARRVLASELSTSVSESYARAYHQIVLVQQLVELEEVAQLRQNQTRTSPIAPIARDRAEGDISLAHLRSLWEKRLKVCQKSVNVWQKLMAARILVVSPKEDAKTWIKFVSICRREERWGLAKSSLKRLGVVGEYDVAASLQNGTPPRAVLAMLKLCWVGANDRPPAGDRTKAFSALSELVKSLTTSLVNTPRGDPSYDSIKRLVVKCRLKLGEWTSALYGDTSRMDAMKHVETAKKLEPGSYKAAHAWASLNFLQFESTRNSQHLIEAIRGFFSSIALGRNMGGSTSIIMQDVLRLLTLWFDQSSKYPRAAQAIREGFQAKKIPIGTWLNVVPQLIARIQSNPTSLRELLVELGSTYPQALVYPLTVAARSVDLRVRGAAEGILSELRTTQATLLDQAALVARELIRVAILLPEEWYEALEDACKAWYPVPTNEGDVRTAERANERYRAFKAVQECLGDLNNRLNDEAGVTRHEAEFLKKFKDHLKRAADSVSRYEQCRGWELPGRNRHMQDAWAEYKKIYAEIGEKYLKELSVLELEDISPMLLAQRDLELAVPGTFRADVEPDQLVKIKAFGSRVKVFPTKQRPRRIGLLGSNGYTYRYLLKGHEDLRQDERAMQLFGLVNALLSKAVLKRDLSIQTFIVIPLSPHVGLIGWLPQTDTLHSLIRRYRAEKRIPLNIEQQWSNKISPLHVGGNTAAAAAAARDPSAPGNAEGYDRLTLLQKVEAFEYSLESNQGDDLAKVMWHKSRSAEVWLDRRTSFTRSLATMSMVGYILGLGDRHPSNLMLHRTSGRIVHIDFGDCFEVAALREKYPERVPFRLTRMLVNAMEVSGIEGNFRISCETVMGILRDNRDSVMAMLEAFVHDPLISWRLWAQQNELQQEGANNAGGGVNRNIHSNGQNGSGELDEQVEDFLGRGSALDAVDEEEDDTLLSFSQQQQSNGRHLERPRPQHVTIAEDTNSQTAQGEVDDDDDADLAQSARARPIPLAPSRQGRAGSLSAPLAESMAASRRERQSLIALSQSYRSRGTRDRQRVRRYSVTFESSSEVPMAIAEPVLNKQAVQVVRRVKDKLTGHDFGTAEGMSVVDQVDKLIRQATAHENLATAFLGWCAFW